MELIFFESITIRSGFPLQRRLLLSIIRIILRHVQPDILHFPFFLFFCVSLHKIYFSCEQVSICSLMKFVCFRNVLRIFCFDRGAGGCGELPGNSSQIHAMKLVSVDLRGGRKLMRKTARGVNLSRLPRREPKSVGFAFPAPLFRVFHPEHLSGL